MVPMIPANMPRIRFDVLEAVKPPPATKKKDMSKCKKSETCAYSQ